MFTLGGKGTLGQLGYELKYDKAEIIDKQKCQLEPRMIDSFKEKKCLILDIYCGKDFAIAYSANSLPFSWGNNDHFQLARDTKLTYDASPEVAENIQKLSLGKIVKTCLGWMHGFILNDKGEAYTWGNPFFDYDKNFYDLKEPMMAKIDSRIIDIACGFHHFCAITLEDNLAVLYTWGANDYGQLGYETKEELSLEPKAVDLYEYKPDQISCGPFQSLCLVKEGKVFAWGHNYDKEIGDYKEQFITKPTEFGWKLKDDHKIKKVYSYNYYINSFIDFMRKWIHYHSSSTHNPLL